MQYLISLPATSAAYFASQLPEDQWFVASDPPGNPLGSGGGTSYLLSEAWKRRGKGAFSGWLADDQRLILHGGGQSRRLPAYAPIGKVHLPMPVWRWSTGQSLEQTLLTRQIEAYERILEASPASAVAICSGDVLLRYDPDRLQVPEADVVVVGLQVAAEKATQFGVLFASDPAAPALGYCLQKPNRETILAHSQSRFFWVDSGLWLLSARAVEALMVCSGWNAEVEQYEGIAPASYELYQQFALGLGASPSQPDERLAHLSSAVCVLDAGEFYHFGTNSDLIESTVRLQNAPANHALQASQFLRHGSVITQNAEIAQPPSGDQQAIWIENAHVPTSWRLSGHHVITGVPSNDWVLELPEGICIDFVPVDECAWCLRVYGFCDAFRGAIGAEASQWCGRPAVKWFGERGMTLEQAGISRVTDLQQAPLFPVLDDLECAQEWLHWLCHGGGSVELAERWVSSQRLSASQLCSRANLARLSQQQETFRHGNISRMVAHIDRSVLLRLDLGRCAKSAAGAGVVLPQSSGQVPPLQAAQYRAFQAQVSAERGDQAEAEEHDKGARETLRRCLLTAVQSEPPVPRNTLLQDQIVWARSPVRLDLAGGWTDTPPYCQLNGGRVVNCAVDLNGQPPIQVFARACSKPGIVIRSIDQGVEETIQGIQALRDYNRIDSSFAIAKAALTLAGFGQPHVPFEGGLELSLLAAVPKGSGLGTSSILGLTVLAALNDLCGLEWDQAALIRRTMLLEQMMTTGGGWQDQAGGLYPGLKVLETGPGFEQCPTPRWVPDDLLNSDRHPILLYYTGIRRVAANILGEVVRGVLLNQSEHLRALHQITDNADCLYEALQRQSWSGVCNAVARSWALNQQLDAATCPAAVGDLLQSISSDLAAAKLLGAGGGGYLLLFARSHEAAARIRSTLVDAPPNASARFVDFSVSSTGLEVTRS